MSKSERMDEFIENLGKLVTDSYNEVCGISSDDKTAPPGGRPKASDMPQPKERRSTALDPGKKFQCEMAERILYNMNKHIGTGQLDYNIKVSVDTAKDIYDHFFE